MIFFKSVPIQILSTHSKLYFGPVFHTLNQDAAQNGYNLPLTPTYTQKSWKKIAEKIETSKCALKVIFASMLQKKKLLVAKNLGKC